MKATKCTASDKDVIFSIFAETFLFMNDDKFLSEALSLALEGIKAGGGPFGAIITRNGEELSRSYNRVVVDFDPTAHAEILAIRSAAARIRNHDLSECTLYSSCEPCPMCLSAIYWAGIKKVYYSLSREDAALAGFSDNLIHEEIRLDPSERIIKLIHLDNPLSSEIFRTWENHEGKIPY